MMTTRGVWFLFCVIYVKDISGLSFTNLDQTIDVNSSTEVGSTVFTVETDDDDVNAVSMTSQSTLFQLDTTDNRSVVVMDCLTAGYQEVVSFQATDGISVVTASLTLDVLDNGPVINNLPATVYMSEPANNGLATLYTVDVYDGCDDVSCDVTDISPSGYNVWMKSDDVVSYKKLFDDTFTLILEITCGSAVSKLIMEIGSTTPLTTTSTTSYETTALTSSGLSTTATKTPLSDTTPSSTSSESTVLTSSELSSTATKTPLSDTTPSTTSSDATVLTSLELSSTATKTPSSNTTPSSTSSDTTALTSSKLSSTETKIPHSDTTTSSTSSELSSTESTASQTILSTDVTLSLSSGQQSDSTSTSISQASSTSSSTSAQADTTQLNVVSGGTTPPVSTTNTSATKSQSTLSTTTTPGVGWSAASNDESSDGTNLLLLVAVGTGAGLVAASGVAFGLISKYKKPSVPVQSKSNLSKAEAQNDTSSKRGERGKQRKSNGYRMFRETPHGSGIGQYNQNLTAIDF